MTSGTMTHEARLRALAALTLGFSAIGLCMLAAATLASAADLPRAAPRETPPPAFAPPAAYGWGYNWAGPYAGVFLGGANQSWTVDFYRNNNHGHAAIGSTGIAYGGWLGYNFMLGPNTVAGIEADLGSSNASQSNNIFDNDTSYSTIDAFGSLRGRLGYAFDRLLVYGTAGLAFGRVTNEIQKGRNRGEEVVLGREWQNGFALGGGMEYAFTQALVGRLEYIYSDYGTTSLTNRDGNLAELSNDMHLVRAGLSFKF